MYGKNCPFVQKLIQLEGRCNKICLPFETAGVKSQILKNKGKITIFAAKVIFCYNILIWY